MNEDDHKDMSICHDFMEVSGRYMSNAVLSELAVTIATELEARGRTKDEENSVSKEAFMKLVPNTLMEGALELDKEMRRTMEWFDE